MSDHQEIRSLLERYERALNASDAELAVGCYADDGAFMAPGLPTASGRAAVRERYLQIFDRIALQVRFEVDEVELTSSTTAFALTRSSGVQTTLESGHEDAESNREVFLLEKADGTWAFKRYLFNQP